MSNILIWKELAMEHERLTESSKGLQINWREADRAGMGARGSGEGLSSRFWDEANAFPPHSAWSCSEHGGRWDQHRSDRDVLEAPVCTSQLTMCSEHNHSARQNAAPMQWFLSYPTAARSSGLLPACAMGAHLLAESHRNAVFIRSVLP